MPRFLLSQVLVQGCPRGTRLVNTEFSVINILIRRGIRKDNDQQSAQRRVKITDFGITVIDQPNTVLA